MDKVRSLQRRARSRRASILLFFLLAGLPIVWLAGAISVDYTRIVTTQRRVAQAADAASLAGALQVVPNDPANPFQASNLIDEPAATAVAIDLVRQIELAQGGSWRVDDIDINITQPVGASPATIDVTIDYTVFDLVFMQMAGNLDESLSVQSGSLTRTAIICEDGRAPTYQATCARPLDNF